AQQSSHREQSEAYGFEPKVHSASSRSAWCFARLVWKQRSESQLHVRPLPAFIAMIRRPQQFKREACLMVLNVEFADVVLFMTAAVLLCAAASDLKHYRIPNKLIMILVGMFLLHTLLSGRWVTAAWSLVLAAIVLVFLIYFHARHWMGGGDVKLLTVAFLWTGIECALIFALLLLGFVCLHAIAARFGWVRSRRDGSDRHARIAFAPAIAAALIC